MKTSDDFSRRYVQRSKQRCRSVPFVIVGSSFNLSRSHRKQRSSPIQSLNLRFIVNIQDHRSFRRTHIETDDVSDFADEERIFREFECFTAMRLKNKRTPNPRYCSLTHPSMFRHGPRAPMRRIGWFVFQSPCDDPLDIFITDPSRRSGTWFIQQSVDSVNQKPSTPSPTVTRVVFNRRR